MNNITNAFRGLAALLLAALFTVNCAWAQEASTTSLDVDPDDATTYILSGYGEYTSEINLSDYTLKISPTEGQTITCTQNVSVKNFSVTSGKVEFSQDLTIASGQTVNWDKDYCSLGGTLYLTDSTLFAETYAVGIAPYFINNYSDFPPNVNISGDCTLISKDRPGNPTTINGDGSITYNCEFMSGLSWQLTPNYSGSTTLLDARIKFNNKITLYDLTSPSEDIIGSSRTLINDYTGYYAPAEGEEYPVALELYIRDGSFYRGEIDLQQYARIKIMKAPGVTGDPSLKILSEHASSERIRAESIFLCSGRLDYKGVMQAGLEIGADATFSPGNSVGTAEVNGWQDSTVNKDGVVKLSGNLLLEQDATGMDMIVADSFEVVSADASIKPTITFDFTTPVLEDTTYDIIEVRSGLPWDSEEALRSQVILNNLPSNATLSFGTNILSVTLAFDPNAVPEPSTWALLVLGAAGMLYWRKKNA